MPDLARPQTQQRAPERAAPTTVAARATHAACAALVALAAAGGWMSATSGCSSTRHARDARDARDATHADAREPQSPNAAPDDMQSNGPPSWIRSETVDGGALCGLGVAGAGFDEYSPYPKELSRERAIKNLAGILGTRVQEAIIDRTTSTSGTTIERASVLTVDEDLLAQVDQMATTEYWLDRKGAGPFAQPQFTYAHACVDVNAASGAFKIDPSVLGAGSRPHRVTPDAVPAWLDLTGKQPGGRVCAIGFSQPTFFKDQTFARVVDNVREQLAEVIETLVGSYYEELTNADSQFVEAMTVATTQALSKGVIVTHYWYDRDGKGPYRQRGTTYGWGCVYPVEVLQLSLTQAEKELPAREQSTIDRVRARAANAFDDLDAEETKRRTSTTRSADPDANGEAPPDAR